MVKKDAEYELLLHQNEPPDGKTPRPVALFLYWSVNFSSVRCFLQITLLQLLGPYFFFGLTSFDG